MRSDVLIIGAGSAGSVVAERISADEACHVTVVEAGPAPSDPKVSAQITDAQGPMNAPPPTTLGLSQRDEHAAAEPVGFFSPPPPNSTVTQTRKGRRYPPPPVAAKSTFKPSPAPQSPPVYGDSTGAPVPASGFLGFGSSNSGQ